MNAEAGGAAGAAATGPVTPGGLLRAERERRGLSLQRAAEELHLDVWLIEAIEANRFVALGARVYARGHLRKYATLLGLSPAVILEHYEALSGTPGEPMPIPAAMAAPVPERRRSMKLPLWIVAALLAAGLAWLAFELLTASSDDGAPPSTAAPAVLPPPVEQLVERTPATTEQAAAPPAPRAQPPQREPAKVAGPLPAAGTVRVRLEFSAPSWTEVYDGAGNRLMFDMGTPGRARTIVGAPPLRVTLGLASAVTAQVDDRPIVIPRRAGRDAARFLIEADGSVRMDGSLHTAEREAVE